VQATPETVWALLLDPDALASIIPGAHRVEKLSDTAFRAEVTLGIGPVKGRYRAEIELSDLQPTSSLTLTGATDGALGFGRGSGSISLQPAGPGRTTVAYRYEGVIGGKVASIGGRLLEGAAKVVIGEFFEALAAKAGGRRSRLPGWLRRLLRLR
jgi:2-furoyl-CoA dehydrogenase large subunit